MLLDRLVDVAIFPSRWMKASLPPLDVKVVEPLTASVVVNFPASTAKPTEVMARSRPSILLSKLKDSHNVRLRSI